MAEQRNSMKVTIDQQNATVIGKQALQYQTKKQPGDKEPKK